MISTSVEAANGPTPTDVPKPPEKPREVDTANEIRHAEPKLTPSRCKCAACGRVFSGLSTFDAHRYWGPNDSRHCHTDDDLAALRHPIVRRGNGVYGAPPMTEQEKRERGWA